MAIEELITLIIEANATGKTISKNESGEWILIDPPAVALPLRNVFTKLEIRRACRSLELEEKLDALLDSSELFRKDWNDATEIDLSDATTLQALAFGDFSENEINEIKYLIAG